MKHWAISGTIILTGATALAACGTVTGTTNGAQKPSTHTTDQATSSRTVSHHTSKKSGRPPSSTAPRGPFNLQSIDMVSPSVGWARNQDAVWWTQDGGRHWSVETPSPLPRDATLTVQVVSKNVAWVAVATNLTQKPPLPDWATTTHGAHWNRTTSPPHNDGIAFITAISGRVAWMATDLAGASGTESMVLDATVDGGKTWTTLPSSVTSQMMAQPDEHPKSAHPIPVFGDKSGVAFASPQEGFITGGQTGQTAESAMLWRTSDGGNKWLRVPLAARAGTVLNWTFVPTFFNPRDGVMAVEANNTELATYATHDGGRTWTAGTLLPFTTQLGGPLWSFATMDFGLYLAKTTNVQGSITGATLYETANGGRSWRPLSAHSLPLRQVKALDDVSSTTAFAVTQTGGRSVVWETQDGGHTWNALKSTQ